MGNTLSMQYFKTITNFPTLNRLLIAEYAVYWSAYKSNGNIGQLKQNSRQKVKGQESYNSIYGCLGYAHASLGKVEFSYVFSQEFNIFVLYDKYRQTFSLNIQPWHLLFLYGISFLGTEKINFSKGITFSLLEVLHGGILPGVLIQSFIGFFYI